MVPNASELEQTWLGMRIFNDCRGPKQALGPSHGVQGGTKEAPRRHQGGTEDAPRRHRGGTEEGPRKDSISKNTI